MESLEILIEMRACKNQTAPDSRGRVLNGMLLRSYFFFFAGFFAAFFAAFLVAFFIDRFSLTS